MFKEILARVVGGQHLSREEAREAMRLIMAGEASDAQVGAFLTALKVKEETDGEITGFAEAMRARSSRISPGKADLIDTCGTGGDLKGTFNVSTTVAFVLAGAGAMVAKHGNRGVSSSCGSSDVLTALGVKVDVPPGTTARAINEIGIGFLYAPIFHQAMKQVAKPRQELGFRTVFNLLGPLTNPAGVSRQLIGVYDRSVIRKVAGALPGLGVKRAMVVHSLDGLDEISTAAPTEVAEVVNGEIKSYVISPGEYGFAPADLEDYRGGSPAENAAVITGILEGKRGPKRDIVLINAAAALLVAEKAPTLRDGVALAAASIDQGAALAKLEELRSISAREGEA
ncbi:MAG TPA: anthranilate phosphoribosyltransferase [Selenomonadales bacterium]|nr:anthranilate phosphoribosyltransferase [Selenomonadales bacterium]